ncbi:ABC-three component system protein [Pedobacter sp. P351]|uniref:ABC-three component system protein n=1 Tax=Pedobacter superstes TaxID=3133441 RepID=UPI0030A4A768
MSKKIDPENVDSAISSWSGFVYQGKVALYHVVKLLTHSLSVSAYTLQLDSLEDFAVIEKGKPISIHQIKALKSVSYSTYKGPFEKLCKKGTEYGGVPAFFHTARRITDKSVGDIEASHAGMKVYLYGTDPNCSLDKIDDLISAAISEFHRKHQPAFLNPDYARKTRHYLDAIIQSRVIIIHSKIHQDLYSENAAAYKELIPFQEFLDVLNEDTIAKISGPGYYLHLTKMDLNRYYQEYCLELPEDIEDDCRLKMNNFAAFLNALSEEQLVKLICKIIPHRSFALDSISDYKDNNIQRDEMKQAFFRCLKELKEIVPLAHGSLNWAIAKEKFVPTSINWTQEYHQDACVKIIENILNTDLDLPFETSSLVTANINVPSVYDAAVNIMDIPEDEANREAEKIMNWKRISLTSIEEAKKKIV